MSSPTYTLTQKDLLELKYWLAYADMEDHRNKIRLYCEAFGVSDLDVESVLEVGPGPLLGILPHIKADVKVGIDPLFHAYEAVSLMPPDSGFQLFSVPFETWDTGRRFDAAFCVDALDHGEMGARMIPQISKFLKPSGRLYLHVHLRPIELLNLIHDHPVTHAGVNNAIRQAGLVEVKCEIYPNDVDGKFCEALLGIWEKP
jgi:hypothetical protein